MPEQLHKDILTLDFGFNKERELYILYQDESIDELTYDILIFKCVTVPVTMLDGFLVAHIINLFWG